MSRKLLSAAAAMVLSGAAHCAQPAPQLLDAGAAPREPVRYRFEAGRSETAVLDTNIQLGLSLGGEPVPVPAMPPLRITMKMKVAEVSADGSARLAFELLSAEATGGDAQSADLNRTLAQARGLTGSYLIDPRGQISDSSVKLPEGASAPAGAEALGEIEQSMQQLVAPFPVEAIGKGARWQVTQEVESNGMQLSQRVEYTLKSRSGNRMELDVKLVNATLDAAAALPPGAKVDSVQLSGGGTSVFELDRLVPAASTDSNIALALSMVAQGQTQKLGLDLKVRQAIAPGN